MGGMGRKYYYYYFKFSYIALTRDMICMAWASCSSKNMNLYHVRDFVPLLPSEGNTVPGHFPAKEKGPRKRASEGRWELPGTLLFSGGKSESGSQEGEVAVSV